MKRYTIRSFDAQFPTDDACLEWLKQSRWPEGITCPKCERITGHHKVTGRPVYACANCGHHVSPMAGTIMEKSATPLRSWFHAMFLMASTRCGISAKQLEREIGVTYKTAWRMFKQIRSMLTEEAVLEGSSVEVDESYFGGKEKNRHAFKRTAKRGRGAGGKIIVAGAVERKGRVIARVVPDVSAKTLIPFIKGHILPASTVYTDELLSYRQVGNHGYQHRRVHHALGVYVDGDASTNTMEGFWSLVKRGIGGVNHAVGARYLQSYLNEYAFRYNRRENEQPMFEAFLSQIVTSAR